MAKKTSWKFSIIDALVYGWKKTEKFFWPMLALAALTYIFVPWFIGILQEAAGAWGVFVRVLSILITVFLLLIWTRVVLSGLSARKKSKTKKRQFWILLGVYVWRQIIIILGLILFIVPGIVWWITYLYAPILSVDKNLNVCEAMRASRKLTTGQRWPLFWWMLVSIAIYLAGLYCFWGAGLLLAMPINNHAGAYVYAKLSGRVVK